MAALQQCLGAPVVLAIDFNVLTAGTTVPDIRFKIVNSVVGQTAVLGGISKVAGAVEQFVAATEVCCIDAGVKRDVLAGMPSLQIRFVNQFGAAPTAKGLRYERGELLYTGVFELGTKGYLDKESVSTFYETNFHARERILVTRFTTDTLPSIHKRLARVTGNNRFVLDFDIPKLLSGVEDCDKRLKMARVLISKVGMTRKVDSMLRKGELMVNNTASMIEVALTGESEQFKADPTAVDNEVYTSPNVIEPLVSAIEDTCSSPEISSLFASSISGVYVVRAAPGAPKTLTIRESPTSATCVTPNTDGSVAFRRHVLVYTGAFDEGTKGCLVQREILEVLESFYLGKEKGMVMELLRDALPRSNEVIRACTTSAVEIEVVWSTIFHPGLIPGAQRLEVAENFCHNGSAMVLQPLTSAFNYILHNTPSLDVRALMAARISRVVIQSVPGTKAKPCIVWGGMQGGTCTPSVMLYTIAMDRAERGCFTSTEARHAIRALLGLPTPPDESGASAIVNKATNELTRLGADLTKGFSKLGFGKKKK